MLGASCGLKLSERVLSEVPAPVDSPLHLVDRHFIEPIPGQEGGRRKHPSHTCFICNVSREALSDAGLGDSYKPK